MSQKNGSANQELDPAVRRAVVAFLRDWLPEPARDAYREMIRECPENWHRHPHFEGGVIVQSALRGNGLGERALGVRNLDPIWPELLREAVMDS